MNSPKSPALRSLQISSDGRTLIGRSPVRKSAGNKSPSVGKGHLTDIGKKSRKITSYFINGDKREKFGTVWPLENEAETDAELTKVRSSAVSVAINTESNLAHLNAWSESKEEILENLYATGPADAYWKKCADDIRRQLNEAILEKLACDDEIEDLHRQKRQLQEELDEYKEYFELQKYTNSDKGENDAFRFEELKGMDNVVNANA